MFHDESNKIAHRNKSDISGRPEGQKPGPMSSNQTAIRVAAAGPMKLTDFVLYQPLDDLGISFFMSTYIDNGTAVVNIL